MTTALDWGLQIVIWFQQFSPGLDIPFMIITVMGSEVFFLGLLPLIYWCVDRRTGAGLTLVFMLSAWLNATAKIIADQPRPFEYSPQVKRIVDASGGGLPSGHTQLAVVTWGYLAYHFRKPWFWGVAVALMILIPLSRIYLGVHFPTDLIGGYVLGWTGLALFLVMEPDGRAWLQRFPVSVRLLLAVGGATLLIALAPGGSEGGLTAAATLAGMSVGFVLEREWVRFHAGGTAAARSLRFVIGGAVLFGIWAGLKVGFAGLHPDPLFRAIRYALVGLWGALGAPWLFVRLKLATVETELD